MNLEEIQKARAGRMNRKDRRASEKKDGIKIIATNVPMKSTKVITSKKSISIRRNKNK